MRVLFDKLSFRRSRDRSHLSGGRRALLASALTVSLALAGCSSGPPAQPGLDLNFAQYGPLPLRVAHIDVVETYQPMSAPPHVELQFTVPPDQAIRRWVADRLRGEGGSTNLTIDITN